MIIGVSGYGRAGKDTVGQILVNEWGFTRFAFADVMKEFLRKVDPIVPTKGSWERSPCSAGFQRLSDVLQGVDEDFDGVWGRAKEFREVRELLQRLGTEAGRHFLGEDIWADKVMDDIANARLDDVVITDVRFPNEVAAVESQKGQVWRINRPGYGPANNHESETALDDWPFEFVIENDGTFDDLRQKVRAIMIDEAK